MNYVYGEWDGTEFPGFTVNPFFQQLSDYILAYGDKALDALQKLDPDNAEMLQQLIDDGMLSKLQGRLNLTPKAVSALQHKALAEMFADLRAGHRDSHEANRTGRGSVRADGTRPYAFGDAVSDIDMAASLRNAVARAGTGLPIRVAEADLEVHNTESVTSCSTVLLLDMSGSMMRYNRFYNAKKVALGMQALIRWKFPSDTLDYVGFYSIAEPIPEARLALSSPKPVSISDWEVDLSFRLSEVLARKRAGRPTGIPEHFTNLQMGLQLARQILARRPSENKQIFIITDGQPTAHVEGDTLRLLYPPSDRTVAVTLQEALLCMQQDIRLVSFALTEDYYDMHWVGFIDRLTKLTRGLAFYCAAPELGGAIMDSYLGGARKKKYLAG